MKKILFYSFTGLMMVNFCGSVFAEDAASLKQELNQAKAQLENSELDRRNLMKQATMFQKEKDDLVKMIEQMKGSSSGAESELDSLKRENEILASEVEKLTAAREKDRALFMDEKQALERLVEDHKARVDSISATMNEYSPEQMEELVADRNRLEQENKRLANKIFEFEKMIEEMKKNVTPLELDREELHRIRDENQQLRDRIMYVDKVESRQEELIRENAQYREEIEILKAKFKEAAPGIAKASRISQKMMKENADMHYNLGTIFLHNKKYRESIKEYERVLELRPNDSETHYNLGILYDDYFKDRDKALYHYQKYLAISPKAPDAKKVESYVLSLELEQKVR